MAFWSVSPGILLIQRHGLELPPRTYQYASKVAIEGMGDRPVVSFALSLVVCVVSPPANVDTARLPVRYSLAPAVVTIVRKRVYNSEKAHEIWAACFAARATRSVVTPCRSPEISSGNFLTAPPVCPE